MEIMWTVFPCFIYIPKYPKVMELHELLNILSIKPEDIDLRSIKMKDRARDLYDEFVDEHISLEHFIDMLKMEMYSYENHLVESAEE